MGGEIRERDIGGLSCPLKTVSLHADIFQQGVGYIGEFMDALVNGGLRGQEIVVKQPHGRNIIISSRGKLILECNGQQLLRELANAMSGKHDWAAAVVRAIDGMNPVTSIGG